MRTDVDRLIEVPAERDFPPGRERLLAARLEAGWAAAARGERREGHPRRRVLVAAAALTLAAGGLLAYGQHTGSGEGGRPLHIVTAGYRLDRDPGGPVTLSVRARPEPDAGRLERDLGRMGLRARVYPPRQGCGQPMAVPVPGLRVERTAGGFTARVDPARTGSGRTLVVALPGGAADQPGGAGLVRGTPPEACWRMPRVQSEDFRGDGMGVDPGPSAPGGLVTPPSP
ncbi:hypothetical protein AB0M28_21375 [Streptomyces sp. NPDC051940]|uniref:hypothetical protein n=1 Tax=Streptomyces sp. NPDC051940 TaxID=3155675 RepID=UPI003423B134